MADISRLRTFVKDMTYLVDKADGDEPQLLVEGSERLKPLILNDDWLPPPFTVASPKSYQQYLLYCDPYERFSVVSFVWGPGQTTPIHNHTVWGLVGVMRGVEYCEEFVQEGEELSLDKTHRLNTGQIDKISPTVGDIHRVTNALSETNSLSIHIYGANIGTVKRHVFVEGTPPSQFVSGYSSEVIPNIW